MSTATLSRAIELGTAAELEAIASKVPSRAQSLSLRALAAQRREREEAAKA